MTMDRREFLQVSAVALAMTQVPGGAQAQDKGAATMKAANNGRRKVIYDQDNAGPLGTDIQGMLMLLQADNIDLLGITLVTGDQWLKQEMAYTLRLLEMMGRTEVPVYAGAEFPMINRKPEALLRYDLYGGHRLDPWLGAFNRGNTGPDEVKPLEAPYGRFADIKPQEEHAVNFIIRTIRENPGEVYLYVGGPLTNIGLAVRMAPDIVPLTKEVIFMGTGLTHFTSSYNVFFDPEAAKIALRAPWPKQTLVTVDLGEEVHIGDDLTPGRKMVEEIAEKAASPIAELFHEHGVKVFRERPDFKGFRMPDEMTSAQIIDPSIFTSSEEMYVDITTTPGARYGDARLWPKDWEVIWRGQRRDRSPQWYAGPPPKAGLATVLTGLDHDRFKQSFVDLMTKPIRKA